MDNNPFQTQLIEARRKHIMEAAIVVIAERGFQRTTIKQIAKKAGIADGTIYNYFKNKDAILISIIEYLSEAEVREIHFAEAEEMDFETFVSTYIEHRMTEMNENFQAMKVVISEMIVNPTLSQQIYEQIYAPGFSIAEAYFKQLMADGTMEDTDPAIAARLFASPLLGLLLLRLIGDEHITNNWDDYVKEISHFILKANQIDNVDTQTD